MKKTGNDELDFLREASSEVFNFQLKAYITALVMEIGMVGIFAGLISILSVTVALWVAVIAGGLITVQALLVAFLQWRARRFVKKVTKSPEALDNAFGGIEDLFK